MSINCWAQHQVLHQEDNSVWEIKQVVSLSQILYVRSVSSSKFMKSWKLMRAFYSQASTLVVHFTYNFPKCQFTRYEQSRLSPKETGIRTEQLEIERMILRFYYLFLITSVMQMRYSNHNREWLSLMIMHLEITYLAVISRCLSALFSIYIVRLYYPFTAHECHIKLRYGSRNKIRYETYLDQLDPR